MPYVHVLYCTFKDQYFQDDSADFNLNQSPLFGPHSTRAASASKAKLQGIPVETIMRAAGWSSKSVFAKYYEKPVHEEQKTVQDAILNT